MTNEDVPVKQQLYLIEIFVDKISVFLNDNESSSSRKLTTAMNFGPKATFVVKEGGIKGEEDKKKDSKETNDQSKGKDKKKRDSKENGGSKKSSESDKDKKSKDKKKEPEEKIEVDEYGNMKLTKTLRVGKSYIIPSYPDEVQSIISKFPLEICVWDDLENEYSDSIYVGVGTMTWDPTFYRWLEATRNSEKLQAPIVMKQIVPLYAECCCAQCGEATAILRLTALGESVMTEYDQISEDEVILRTDKLPTIIKTKKLKGEDCNFLPVGAVYETATLDDPEALMGGETKYEICTEMQPCAEKDIEERCKYKDDDPQLGGPCAYNPKKYYKVTKVRMGDITGPCGNPNCDLAKKVRDYIRSQGFNKKAELSDKDEKNKQDEKDKKGKKNDKSKKDDKGKKDDNTKGKTSDDKDKKKISCGKCVCEDETQHRESCKEHNKDEGDGEKGDDKSKKMDRDKKEREKKDGDKKADPKRTEGKKEDSKKEDSKKENSKKEDSKKEDSKKEGSKKDESKKEGKKEVDIKDAKSDGGKKEVSKTESDKSDTGKKEVNKTEPVKSDKDKKEVGETETVKPNAGNTKVQKTESTESEVTKKEVDKAESTESKVMQQLYLVEIFLDKIYIHSNQLNEGKDKELTARVTYEPDNEYIFRPGRQVKKRIPDKDVIDENGQLKYVRYFRMGNSVLFTSYPDKMYEKHKNYPVQIQVWNDVEDEHPELIGVGQMEWHSDFITYLKGTSSSCEPHKSLTRKEEIPLWQECCCTQVGEARVIVRMHSLGDSIVSDMQQDMDNPDKFVLRSNKYDNAFEAETVDPDDDTYNTEDSPYEVTRRNPKKVQSYHKPVEVCTELESCKFGQKGLDDLGCSMEEYKADKDSEENEDEEIILKPQPKPKPRLEKIRMGDIKGPCGNSSCPVAHRVKTYIRNMKLYKKAPNYPEKTKPRVVCGGCACAPDKYNAEHLTEEELERPMKKSTCGKCGGKTQEGETCEDKIEKMYGTGLSPKGSRQNTVHYLTSVTRFTNPLFHNTYIVNNLTIKYFNQMMAKEKLKNLKRNPNAGSKKGGCGCCEVKFLKHLNKERVCRLNTPISKNPYSFVTKSPEPSQDTTIVPFTGGFNLNIKPSTSELETSTTARHYHPMINNISGSTKQKSMSPKDSGFGLLDSQISPAPYVSGLCGCSKLQRPTTVSGGCVCSRPKYSNIYSFHAKSSVKPFSDYGYSKPKSVNTPEKQLISKTSMLSTNESNSSSQTSNKSSKVSITEDTEETTVTASKSAPEIRLGNRQHRRPDLVNPIIYNVKAKDTNKDKDTKDTKQKKEKEPKEPKDPYDDEDEEPPHFCLEMPDDKECRCNPPIPSGACNTFDCNCITETIEAAARRAHKPWCTKYKHKKTCLVTLSQEEEQQEEEGIKEEDEPQPYCLPPIQLGPCPVIGRPCSVPDGFARMYKNALEVQPQPASYSEDGKVCCSKEFERIKKAIDEYLKETKERDLRCINRYNIDTEKRCCDKEQALLALIGKSCCGTHKMEIQEKYKDKK